MCHAVLKVMPSESEKSGSVEINDYRGIMQGEMPVSAISPHICLSNHLCAI